VRDRATDRHDHVMKGYQRLMNTALLLIDIQKDYFPGGRMEVEGSVEAGLCAKKLLSFFRQQQLPLVHVQHINIRPGATFFVPGTEGTEIHENVKPLPDELVVQKNYPNSFRNTALLEHLQNQSIKHVVICGMMTHMCVDATARAAFDHGLRCTVVSDACATIPLTFGDKTIPADYVQGAFLAALKAVYATIVNAQDFIYLDCK
jgi:nicotinamidase-related amidase